MALGSAKAKSSCISEEEKLDQEDQRMKIIELDKLEDLNEGNASIARGDWIHRIRLSISNLSKRAKQYWKIVEKIVEERRRKRLVSSPVEKLNSACKDDEEEKKSTRR